MAAQYLGSADTCLLEAPWRGVSSGRRKRRTCYSVGTTVLALCSHIIRLVYSTEYGAVQVKARTAKEVSR